MARAAWGRAEGSGAALSLLSSSRNCCPPDPPCHPSPAPLGALHPLWKKILPVPRLQEEHQEIKAGCCRYSPAGRSEPSLCGFPGSRSPFPALVLSWPSSPTPQERSLPPAQLCRTHWDVLGTRKGGWSSFGAIPRLRSPWNLGWSWDSHLPPATDAAAGRDGV